MSQSLSATELDELSRDITEELQQTSICQFDWNACKFFVMANSKDRFQVWLSPEALVFDRRRQLGYFFHASDNSNYEPIRNYGPGTVIKYGSYVFYAKLGVESFFAHGHELHDPGGLRYEKKALRMKMAQGATKGNSPQGEVPEALRKIIRENGLLTRRRKKQGTQSEGTTRYAYEAGDTVHGKMDARRAQQEEELRQVLRKARTNPWHLFGHGLLHRVDQAGNNMYSTYGDALVKTTPWDSLPAKTRKLLGGNYIWATWLQHPMSGYGIHFFLKVELGKLQGNYLVEFSHKPHVYSQGYVSPRDRIPPPLDEDLRDKETKSRRKWLLESPSTAKSDADLIAYELKVEEMHEPMQPPAAPTPGDIRSTLDDRQMEKVTRRKSGTYHWKRGRVLLFISALILNRGNFTRGRKRSAPSAFADHIDYHDSGERAAKAHPFMLREAGSEIFSLVAGPNLALSKITQLAGSTLVGVAHSHLPRPYMIVDITFGKNLPTGGQGNRGEFPDSALTRILS
ncbi:unnamed protein product [Symbiodinium sp. KB8]|nr:unnamed protein product [Symbiodinium sp. KB8]